MREGNTNQGSYKKIWLLLLAFEVKCYIKIRNKRGDSWYSYKVSLSPHDMTNIEKLQLNFISI